MRLIRNSSQVIKYLASSVLLFILIGLLPWSVLLGHPGTRTSRTSSDTPQSIEAIPENISFASTAIPLLPSPSPSPGTWTITGDLNFARSEHTATLLANGKVLIAGGRDSGGIPFNKAELYDPATGIWSTTGDLNFAREDHTATRLANGEVLVAGGFGGGLNRNLTPNKAELYDPGTGRWTITGDLNFGRAFHTSTLLSNGHVLVAGGFRALNKAELYHPSPSPVMASKIAFDSNRDGNSEIYIMNADGSSQTRLTNNTSNDYLPALSPDGRKIAFESNWL